jgi:integrase
LSDVGEAMRIWLNYLESKAEGTRRIYIRSFMGFLERWNLDADLFYEDVRKAVKNRYEDPRPFRVIQSKVQNYLAELKRSGKSASTCKQVYKAVRSFLEAQGIDGFSLKAKDKPRGESNGQRLILPDQIRKIYDKAGMEFQVRNRAILLFQKDSGLRVSDTVNLNVSDYQDVEVFYNNDGEYFKAFAPFKTKKMSVIAHIHIGPESIQAIDNYLKDRQRNNVATTRTSPLFLMRRDKRFTADAMTALLKRLSGKLEKSRKISAHSLRKFHTTMLESEMPRSYVAKLQGKKVSGSMGPYERPEDIPGELMKHYMAGYDRIRVFKPSTEDLEARKKLSNIETILEERDLEINELKSNIALYEEKLMKQQLENNLIISSLQLQMEDFRRSLKDRISENMFEIDEGLLNAINELNIVYDGEDFDILKLEGLVEDELRRLGRKFTPSGKKIKVFVSKGGKILTPNRKANG